MIKDLIVHAMEVAVGKVPRGTKRSDQWPEVRKAHLLKEPICQCCQGKTHLQVHHLSPFHLHPELELLDANLITLCEDPGKNCHILFGHLRNFKSFNINCQADVKIWRDKVKNRPATGENV